jgi:hypothetical protein
LFQGCTLEIITLGIPGCILGTILGTNFVIDYHYLLVSRGLLTYLSMKANRNNKRMLTAAKKVTAIPSRRTKPIPILAPTMQPVWISVSHCGGFIMGRKADPIMAMPTTKAIKEIVRRMSFMERAFFELLAV